MPQSEPVQRFCISCRAPLVGRTAARARYCSNACRQRAYRGRAKRCNAVGSVVHGGRLVGRTEELAELTRLLSEERMVTITGPAGIGKTRLAVELAERESNLSHRRAVVLDLANTPTGTTAAGLRGLVNALAPGTAGQAGTRRREQLLFLDNCENALETLRPTLRDLLDTYPGLRIATTCREPWRLPGETVYPVAGLPTPDPNGAGSVGSCLASDAVRLFVDRCTAVSPDFQLSEENAANISAICQRLDGIPLLLELTAQLVRTFSTRDIRELLVDQPTILNIGMRAFDRRHRNWAEALRSSYDALTAEERQLFRRLSLLPGSFGAATAAAAYGGACTSADADQILHRLRDKSLVTAPSGNGDYSVLACIRSFARHQLTVLGEENEVVDRLADWFTEWNTSLSQEAFPSCTVVRGHARERDNIEAILTHLPADDDRRSALAALLTTIELHAGEPKGGLDLVTAALEAADPSSPHRDSALEAALALAVWWRAEGLKPDLVDEAERIARGPGCDAARLRLLLSTALHRELTGDRDTARSSLDICRRLAERHGFVTTAAVCAGHQARHLLNDGDHRGAARLLDIARTADRSQMPAEHLRVVYNTRGALSLASDDVHRAEAEFQRALAAADSLSVAADSVLGLALCAGRTNRFRRALTLLASLDQRPLLAPDLFPGWREEWREVADVARRMLPDSAVAEAHKAGSGRDPRDAVDPTAPDQAPDALSTPQSVLSLREWEVTQLVMQGHANHQIAVQMNLSVRSVENHIRDVRTVLGLRSRAHVAAWAARHTSAAIL